MAAGDLDQDFSKSKWTETAFRFGQTEKRRGGKKAAKAGTDCSIKDIDDEIAKGRWCDWKEQSGLQTILKDLQRHHSRLS